jgi:uncharacterized protein YlxW (UPF0749 family)
MVASGACRQEDAAALTEYGFTPSRRMQSGLADRAMLAAMIGVFTMLAMLVARIGRQAPEPRIGRRLELVELIQAEQVRNAELAQQVDQLREQLAMFEQGHVKDDEAVKGLKSRVDETRIIAGLTAVEGPGLKVTLNDSALEQSPTGDPNDLVIHEQDLQAVINALWAGGAEAMSVMGERVLGDTAIRCVGNTLLLHGRVYSPPYSITAIGHPAALTTMLERDPAVARFREAVAIANLGFGVARSERLKVPAHEHGVTLRVARTARPALSTARSQTLPERGDDISPPGVQRAS